MIEIGILVAVIVYLLVHIARSGAEKKRLKKALYKITDDYTKEIISNMELHEQLKRFPIRGKNGRYMSHKVVMSEASTISS